MSTAHELPDGHTYASAQLIYRAAGWIGPIPLAEGTKWPPPDGFTGWHGAYPSGADSQAWVDEYPEYATTRQLALRMAEDVIGIDVDQYGEKRGAETLAEAERRWGPLPPAPKSSARGKGPSGIRFYAVPPGTELRTHIGFPELKLGGIEIIQRHHRYAVVWPSIHPDTGSPYLWYATASPSTPPRVTNLKPLPDAWLEALASDGEISAAAANPETVNEFARTHNGGGDLHAIRGVLAVFHKGVASGARHDAMLAAVCMAAREARDGRYPAADVRAALRNAFTQALAEAKPRQRLAGPAEARREFDSMWAWGVGQALNESEESRAQRRERQEQRQRQERPEQAPEGDEETRDSWTPMDLTACLDGTLRRPETTVGAARHGDGLRFFYPGLEHAVIGETEGGKTWFLLASSAAELNAGNRVVYVHFEEGDPEQTVGRLLRQFKVPRHRIMEDFLFFGPEHPVPNGRIDEICAERVPTLVVLDGQNEAMALHGQKINDPDGVANFRRRLVKPWTRRGSAVAAADHVVKDPNQNATGYALGSVHKLNGLSGAGFLVENREAFGEGLKGNSGIYVVKDRPGRLRKAGKPTDVARKFHVAEMVIDDTGDLWDLKLYAPKPIDDGPDDEFEQIREQRRLREFDESVYQVVADLAKKQIEDITADLVVAQLHKRRQDVLNALHRLTADKRVVPVPVVGRAARRYELPPEPSEEGGSHDPF